MAMEDNQPINEILERAFRLALNSEHEYVTLEHLTMVLLEHKDVVDILTAIKVSATPIIEDIKTFLDSQDYLVVSGLTKPRKTQNLVS